MGHYNDSIKIELEQIVAKSQIGGQKSAALGDARTLNRNAHAAYIFGDAVSLEVARAVRSTCRKLESDGNAKARALGFAIK